MEIVNHPSSPGDKWVTIKKTPQSDRTGDRSLIQSVAFSDGTTQTSMIMDPVLKHRFTTKICVRDLIP